MNENEPNVYLDGSLQSGNTRIWVQPDWSVRATHYAGLHAARAQPKQAEMSVNATQCNNLIEANGTDGCAFGSEQLHWLLVAAACENVSCVGATFACHLLADPNSGNCSALEHTNKSIWADHDDLCAFVCLFHDSMIH